MPKKCWNAIARDCSYMGVNRHHRQPRGVKPAPKSSATVIDIREARNRSKHPGAPSSSRKPGRSGRVSAKMDRYHDVSASDSDQSEDDLAPVAPPATPEEDLSQLSPLELAIRNFRERHSQAKLGDVFPNFSSRSRQKISSGNRRGLLSCSHRPGFSRNK